LGKSYGRSISPYLRFQFVPAAQATTTEHREWAEFLAHAADLAHPGVGRTKIAVFRMKPSGSPRRTSVPNPTHQEIHASWSARWAVCWIAPIGQRGLQLPGFPMDSHTQLRSVDLGEKMI
jgi:hypothetical protein